MIAQIHTTKLRQLMTSDCPHDRQDVIDITQIDTTQDALIPSR